MTSVIGLWQNICNLKGICSVKIILPLSVAIPRKKVPDKVWTLNLNLYRNANFHLLNQAKTAWKDNLRCGLFEGYRPDREKNLTQIIPPYHFIYTVFPAARRSFDVSNVCSIVDKFTADALQELGIIENDNYKIIPMVTYRFGQIDKENPRVELEIKTYENYDDLPF